MRSTRDYMADQIAELTAERDALAAELSRLRTLEAALPKTADGVPIVFDRTYWFADDDDGDSELVIGEITVRDIEGPHALTKGRWLICGTQCEVWAENMYSTLEEAEKARQQ